MKKAYEIAEFFLKLDIKNDQNEYIEGVNYNELRELIGVSQAGLYKLMDKAKLTVLIEKVTNSLKELENFFSNGYPWMRFTYLVEDKYEGTLSPKTMKLIAELKKALETEKSLLPVPTVESVKDD